jgi:hypothetical protein
MSKGYHGLSQFMQINNQGSKRKMNSIQRVSANMHKTMNFTLTKNINRYKMNYAVTNAVAK